MDADAFYGLEGELPFEIGRQKKTIWGSWGGFVAAPPGVHAVHVRCGHLFARCVLRLGDRGFVSRDTEPDLTLATSKDRLAADARDDLRVPGRARAGA